MRVITARAAGAGPAAVAVGAAASALALPWVIYPPVALDIACWALFAVAVDLLLGFTGLLSFGHAAFWGTVGVRDRAGRRSTPALPFPVAVLGGALAAAVLAVPIGYLSVKRTGIYFAMVTLAFAQMVYFVANQWRVGHRRRERPAGRAARAVRPRPVRPVLLLLRGAADRAARAVRWPGGSCTRRSAGCWSRSGTTRPGPGRWATRSHRYKLLAFVLSAFAGRARPAGCSRSATGSPRCRSVHWTTSGKAVMMVVLGGIGTLWGGVRRRGAGGPAGGLAVHGRLRRRSAWSPARIFVVVVLLFRRGIWGTARHLLLVRRRGREVVDPEPGVEPASVPAAEPVR